MPSTSSASRRFVFFVLFAVWLRSVPLAQAPPPAQAAAPASPGELKLDTGKDIFEAACIGCHGPGGRGQPQTTLGFEPPATFPDFSDCNGSTRERTFDWRATIHEGGAGRGFSEIMPSFAEALTLEQIDRVMAYLRSLCTEPGWPLGELNLPRALATEKAYPEDETVVAMSVNANGSGAFSTDFIYEKRIGARNQLEIAGPITFASQDGDWAGGVGDLIFGYKRVLAANSRTGSIVSVQGEVSAPSGNSDRDLGAGVTIFETFASVGQILPRASFVQVQTGAEFPTDTDKAPKAVFARTAVGKTFSQNRGFGRSWTPMAEIIVDRDLDEGASTNWDLVPEMQITLNRRQHLRVNIGVRTPLNHTAGRSTQILFYALWDWFDGGLRDGW
ncbi:MAG TPA: cytochrome c [Vicinamibacterales bacterium]|jgi:mono/diheme cytochrome c family protein|nr:cytochrome c [Vicinamibacterales bacterium]